MTKEAIQLGHVIPQGMQELRIVKILDTISTMYYRQAHIMSTPNCLVTAYIGREGERKNEERVHL